MKGQSSWRVGCVASEGRGREQAVCREASGCGALERRKWEHWLQRLSLVLARGQADLVLEAVKTARKNHRGRDGGRGASAEWSQTDCQPCVSLV